MDALRIRSQSALARNSDVPQPTINRLLNGKTGSPDTDTLRKLAAALSVSPDWLLTGREVGGINQYALRSDEELRSDLLAHQISRGDDAVRDGYIRLKMFDAHACMGAAGEPVDFPEILQYVDVLRDYIISELRCNPDNIDLLPARGDSMKGTIEHGDIAFVDRTARSFDGDGIYVIVWGNGLMIKRLQAMPSGGLSIISDNDKYKAMDVTPEQADGLTICGRVTGKWAVSRI